MAQQQRTAFKDYFDRAAAKAMAGQIAGAYPDFDKAKFIRHCTGNLASLEYHDRVKKFSAAMKKTLPDHYPDAVAILQKSLPPLLPGCESITDGWLQWPVGQFIADNGVQHFSESMDAMHALTQRFSAEFAVRPFVEHQPQATFCHLYTLLDDPSPHVRRWCSEGTRTRLPWGNKLHGLIADPSPVWPVLDALCNDDSLYVRRSVANNLNDLSKDHPEAVLKRCKLWRKDKSENVDRVIKHGLRGLIKAGDPQALSIIGFGKPVKIEATLKATPGKIRIGESTLMKAVVENKSARAQDLMIDYIVYYQGKNGGERAKVFKWKTISLAKKQQIVLEKKHPMRITSIRALYAGRHRLALQINGAIVASGAFRLLAES